MHLIKNNQIRQFNTSKKKIFLIISFFITILLIFFLSIKSQSKPKKSKENEYEEIIKEINAKKNLNFTKIKKFIVENENIYGTLISLSSAKQYILKNNLEKAFVLLQTSLKYTKEENLKNILRLRMSKIKIEQNKEKDAMQILQEIKDDSWTNIVENIKGDIFIKSKNIKLAIKAWEKSKYFEESKAFQEIINMKINQAQIK